MSDFWADQPALSSRLGKVRAAMGDVLLEDRFPLAGAVRDLVDANGKMLRPAFLLLAGDFGKHRAGLVPLAAAVELLHVATLIHDDIIDNADTRRGVPAVHARFGVKDAVLAGDWLFSRCFRLAAESSNPENARLLARLVGSICSEEIHQDLENFLWPRSVRNYLRKIAGKTAALFSLALRAGAQEAKAPARVVSILTRVGYDVGMAFQVMDDVLDFQATEGEMRKPVGKDLREGLCTLPLILALRSRAAAIEPHLSGRFMSNAAVAAVLAEVRASGALETARSHAARYTDRALAELRRLPAGAPRDELRLVVEKLLARSS